MITTGQYLRAVHAAGVRLAPSTLRRWASEGIIPSPRGMGRAARWPDEAIEATVRRARVRELIRTLRDADDATIDAVLERLGL